MRKGTQLVLLCMAVSALAAGLAAAEQCREDCTHATKACLCAIDGQGDTISRRAAGGVEQTLPIRQALEVGDEILSASETVAVGLTCPGGSEVKLQGPFRIVIMPTSAGQDCKLDLLEGNAEVQTDTSTALASRDGEILMGSRHTLYSMRVQKTPEDTTVECLVFEGEAEVRSENTEWTRVLDTGQKAAWKDGRIVEAIRPVSDRDIATAATLYSRLDVARVQARGVTIEAPEALRASLQDKYAAVLKRPQDPAPRIELATVQTSVQISKPALYHLDKAEQLQPAQTDQQTAIAATKWAAYKQIGREQEAAVESDKVRRLDPQKHQELERSDPKKVNPGIYRDVAKPAVQESGSPRPPAAIATQSAEARIFIDATASPPTVRPGRATTITVIATTADGRPIVGATVKVSTGGGVFRATQTTRSEGSTDSSGSFRSEWTCRPCTASYRIDIEVSSSEFGTSSTTLSVGTR